MARDAMTESFCLEETRVHNVSDAYVSILSGSEQD